MWRRLFLDHPRTMGESYGEHLSRAAGFAGELLGAGCACLLHGLVPALFEHTASSAVTRLNQKMALRAAAAPKRIAPSAMPIAGARRG